MMAEPVLTTIGSVASVAQILDCAIRLSQECHSFLSAIKRAPEDIKATIIQLSAVLDIVLRLKIYVEELKITSSGDDKERAIIPVAIADSVYNLQATLIDLRNLIPHDSTNGSLNKRVRWVRNKKRLRELSQRLENGNSTLQLALQVIAQYVLFALEYGYEKLY
jgi:hypothetical protein